MKIQVSVGGKEPIVFNNGKVSVVGSQGITHSGIMQHGIKHQEIPHQGTPGQGIQGQGTSNSGNTIKAKAVSVAPLIKKDGVFTEIQMGQKINILPLLKEDKSFVFGLNWEADRGDFDLDISVFLVDEGGKSKEEWFVFYSNKVGHQGCVALDEDLGLGLGSHFQKMVSVNLNKVMADVHKIAVVATLYEEGQTFSHIRKGSIKMVDSSKQIVLDYGFADRLTDENAIVICELYRHQDHWKIRGIGQGFKGGLPALCKNYGIEVE